MQENQDSSQNLGLAVGSQVYWTDPDCGLSSGYYTIESIEIDEGEFINSDTIINIKNEHGSSAQVFAHELGNGPILDNLHF